MVSAEFNFSIRTNGTISQCFLARDITDLKSAASFTQDLPYGRNTDKNDLTTVFTDGCGTCSTKHALLKQLATENEIKGVQLILCIYKMGAINSPAVRPVLGKYGLAYMPEAHNYLRVNGDILDITRRGWAIIPFQNDIISEIEIEPEQITDFKVSYHKQVIKDWLLTEPHISYSPEELFAIREQCIAVFGN